jgi:Spy/CpxP family protein refolding chaperone
MKLSKIALLGALLAISAAVSGQEAMDEHAKHRMHMHGFAFGGETPLTRLVQRLDLSEEQRQNLDSLLDSKRAEQESLQEQQRANVEASLTTLPDDPAYPALVEKRKELASTAIQQRSDLNVQIYALLTPEQKARVPQLIEEMRAHMKERRAMRQRPSDEKQL